MAAATIDSAALGGGGEPYYFGLPPPTTTTRSGSSSKPQRVSMPPKLPTAREDAARRGVFSYTYIAHAVPGAISLPTVTAAATRIRLEGRDEPHDRRMAVGKRGVVGARPGLPVQTRSEPESPVDGGLFWPRPTTGAHQRHHSASASLPSVTVPRQQTADTLGNDPDLHLRPPQRFSLRVPPKLSPLRHAQSHHGNLSAAADAADMAAMMHHPPAQPQAYYQHQHHPQHHAQQHRPRHQNYQQEQQQYEYAHPPQQYAAAPARTARPQRSSTEDFIARTERSTARARAMEETQQKQQQQNRQQPQSEDYHEPRYHGEEHQRYQGQWRGHHQQDRDVQQGGQYEAQPEYNHRHQQQQQQRWEDYYDTRQEYHHHHQQQQQHQPQYQPQQQSQHRLQQRQQLPQLQQPQQQHHQQQHQQQPRLHHHRLQTSQPVELDSPAADTRPPVDRLLENASRSMAPANFPRRSSSASNVSASTAVTTQSRQSFDSLLMRTPSWGSQTSYDSFHSARQGPAVGYSASAWQRPQLANAPRRKARPGELFSAMPGEVLQVILDRLKTLHLAPGSNSCATCWMRDACSVAVSSRKWLKFAREALYGHIQLVGADSPQHKKKYKGVVGTRLVLLRRSLRANPLLAVAVKSLKVPATPPGVAAEDYQDLVATVVMACPNLEQVLGFYPSYDHAHGRFFQAMSTRERLREMTWVVQPSPFQRQQRIRKPAPAGLALERDVVSPGELQPQQTIAWVDMHHRWRHLTTLRVHCTPGATLTPDTLLVDTLAGMGSLKSLYLSHLPHNAFNDASLLRLPGLKKLSLVHMAGVTSAGLSAFAMRGSSRGLESLTLVHANIRSLPALARTLSNLKTLKTLSLVQSFPPMLPADEVIWLFPYLASASLTRLHWDIAGAQGATAADSILARSIAADGFPALQQLRAPADPDGMFQALCHPIERADLPADRFRQQRPGPRPLANGGQHSRDRSGSGSQRSVDSTGKKASSPTSTGFPVEEQRLCNDLHQARLAAQGRIEAARNMPRIVVNVTEEDGSLVDRFGLAGYMGEVRSKVRFDLLPDAGGQDEKGGLVDMWDLLGDGGEDLSGPSCGLASVRAAAKEGPAVVKKEKKDKEKDKEERRREGCQGRWNAFAVADKKDRWWHTERGRWRGVDVS